jgi:antitoxin (DNA-binding transcriptional repressor) of toxin-antitoxin stability system
MKEKFITTNELANDASKILRELKSGEGVIVLRYSEPVGALVSWDDYTKIQRVEAEKVSECKACLKSIKRSVGGE